MSVLPFAFWNSSLATVGMTLEQCGSSFRVQADDGTQPMPWLNPQTQPQPLRGAVFASRAILGGALSCWYN